MRQIMMGRPKETLFVVSITMTVSESVMRTTPANMDAAPITAYAP